mgnify:CR=1 FL=1
MMSAIAGIVYSNEILFQGFIDGLIYALIAIGLVPVSYTHLTLPTKA